MMLCTPTRDLLCCAVLHASYSFLYLAALCCCCLVLLLLLLLLLLLHVLSYSGTLYTCVYCARSRACVISSSACSLFDVMM